MHAVFGGYIPFSSFAPIIPVTKNKTTIKKFLGVFAVLFVVAFAANAQDNIEKGKFLIGAQTTGIGFQSESGNGTTVSSFNVGVNGAYYFIKGLAGGVLVNVNSNSVTGSNTITTFSAGPIVRYTYGFSDKFGIFGQGNVLFGSQSGGGSSVSTFGFNVGPGLSYFANEHVQIDLGLNFGSNRFESNGVSTTRSVFGAAVGFNIVF